MAQNQKQREPTCQASRSAGEGVLASIQSTGERVIAILDLVIGVPLALGLLFAFLQEPAPRDWAGYFFGTLVFLLTFGLNGAGICLLLRRYALARALQWVPAVIMLAYISLVAAIAWRNGLDSIPLLVITGTLLIALISLALPLLLRKLTED